VVRFAHPVERELARVFDDHGVRREYEPHTFVLERHADGSVQQRSERLARRWSLNGLAEAASGKNGAQV
jgi:hypothetical protein